MASRRCASTLAEPPDWKWARSAVSGWRVESAAASPWRREHVLALDGGNEVGAKAIVVERHDEVGADDAVLADQVAKADRGVVEVVALDLQEERRGDRIGLSTELIAAEEDQRAGERAPDLRQAADRPQERAAADVVAVDVDADVDQRLEAVGEDARDDERRGQLGGASALKVLLVAGRQTEREPGGEIDRTTAKDDVF